MKLLMGGLAVAVLMAGGAKAQSLSGSLGADYSTGDYGTGVNTDILMVPLTLRAEAGELRLSATAPYIRMEGASNVLAAGEGGPIAVGPEAAGEPVSRDGFGDLTLGAAYTLPASLTGAFGVDLSGRVKLPTGDEGEGLSTGETDFAVATDVSYPLGAWTPFVTLGYRLRGDPEGIDLDNTLYTSLGATYAVSDSSVLTFSYDYAQASTDFVEDSHELFAGYTAPLVGRVNWTLYGLAGLSEGSPDITAGVQLSAPFS